ncbi:PREDICTED: lactosylceramide 4-alpha-galactosyltransferase-like [Drosophila arizonae]|uniref:Lactosylceramide 4-alpha-galactosyltransferase-like n=1 Tax=Drosophila arizonae TaxID=7263 RepID=A0ABM1NWN8_DROAR|nr:PREDICTED: lactosylceramide 4-alpha-galactosyltransferase-like [Drosophila arizonae]
MLKKQFKCLYVIVRRLVIPVLAATLIFLVVLSSIKDPSIISNGAFGLRILKAKSLSTENLIENILYSSLQPPPGRSIFFHETSCTSPDAVSNIMTLTARQACSIESAALNNPNFQIFTVFSCPTFRPLVGRQKLLVDAIESYENVNLRHLNLRNYAMNTSIEDWVKRDDLFTSNYPVHHTSDLLRLISLYRFGGIYLDMDIIVLTSLEKLPLNYVGAESIDTLCSAVIGLTADGIGHEVADLFLQQYQKYFNGKNYVQNGPTLVTAVLLKFCGTSLMKAMEGGRKSCKGFRIFNSTAFYSIHWQEWRHFTEPKYLEETMARTKDSLMIHMWNKLSSGERIKVTSNTAYVKYAEKHCPRTYAAAGDYF